MTEQILDLSGFAPETVRVKLLARELVVSNDAPPALVSRAFNWLSTWGAEDIDKSVGFAIASEFLGITVEEVETEVGLLGVVQLLRFFAENHNRRMAMIFSNLPSELPERSTEELPSENSSEAIDSSDSPLTS